MERPPESMKSFANRIAQLTLSEDVSEAIRYLRLSGFLGVPSFDNSGGSNSRETIEQGGANQSAQTNADAQHVGIWERKIEDGKAFFVRRMETMVEWDHWANLGRIEAKSSKARVLLIGESVARGYLYDPEFTPAMALQMILEPHFKERGVEVIDLARTNLGYEVRQLAIEALQLEPDAVVIFSGNNWSISYPGPADIAELDLAMSRDGVAGARRFSEADVGRLAGSIVNDVASAYQDKGVPLIWMVPEFNLGDWRDPISNPPYFPDGLSWEWLTLLSDAQAAMRDREFQKAEQFAKRMIEIDGGLCVAGLYILAECREREKDFDGQRRYLEMARDAVTWDRSWKVMPRALSVTQQAIRDESRKHGNQLVDLPVLFKEYLNGGVPGRRLIIDYCHLTSEGIRIAMGAAASCVLRVLRNQEANWYVLVGEHIAPPAKTEAESAFLAAIHNAHGWQSYDIARYYCSKALSLSPHIAELMLNYIELQTRNLIPMLMGESDERISRLGSPLMGHYLLRLNEKRLDRVLLDAIADSLEEVGIDGRQRLDQLRREEHSVAQRETNLLEFYYSSAAVQIQELSWLSRPRMLSPTWLGAKPSVGRSDNEPQYYKAYGAESRFLFVGESGVPVRLCLTCRLPRHRSSGSEIAVELNGRREAEIQVTRDWSTWDIVVSGEDVREGLNDVTLRWPMPQFDLHEALNDAVLSLCESKIPDFYPSFGEIHSFTASDGRETAA